MENSTNLNSSNFIGQARQGNLGYWKYLVPSILFFGFMGLNILTVLLLDIDQAQLIKDQIDRVGANWAFVITVSPLAVFCLLLLVYVKHVHKQSLISLTTSRPKIDWSRVGFSFAVISLLILGATLYDYNSNPSNYVIIFEPVRFFTLLVIAIILIPLQTSFEEYLFRGYLLQGVGSFFKSRLLALMLTSILFGVMHIANPEINKIGYVLLVSYIGTGFFLGIITLMDEGLELALGFHAANNLVTVLLVTSDWTAFQTNSILRYVGEPNQILDIFIPVLVIYPLIIIVFSKKYKWSNWRQKLTGKA
ncbi:CPBP family intramembrane glutamic endopeptidase [Psychroflexus sp. ALD_RP9]|uniref:CPBP family intramembrane glutamic endopeptidase n=1 Tax=Psychroflexus sp. ALD_RP9 TaxID=2777186 RepID=UPI001A90A5EE|nr:CPBP family intramembrane glutamic endopeptidase [Psychroflexus sp. ALD_RP9]QSS97221.1 CPBP family intramembrane metalloprotease [Psychroflexus sp. ALD_RP9]